MRRVNVAVVPTVCVCARGRTWVRRWVRVRMIHVWHDMREVHTRLPLEATSFIRVCREDDTRLP
jgi:hypothetical protein